MSDKKNQDANHLGTTGVYGQLLGMATAAKGEEKMDPNVAPMKEDDRKWLENALNEIACEADPVKKLKSLIAKLMNYTHETEEDLVTLTNIVDTLIDLVCDLDFALVFCQLSGLSVIEGLLDKDDDEINQRVIGIVSEIAQNNQPVQKIIVGTNLLRRLLTLLQSPLNSKKTQLKIVGAISAIVKGFPAGVIQFVKLSGPDTVMTTFYDAIKAEDHPLVHRSVVAITNIGTSAAPALIEALKINVKQYIDEIRTTLEAHGDKYAESLEYLSS